MRSLSAFGMYGLLEMYPIVYRGSAIHLKWIAVQSLT